MFVHYFTHVPVDMATVEHRLEHLRGSFEEWAGVAYRQGEELRAKVGPTVDGFAKEVTLEIGTPEVHRSGIVYPVKWAATGASVLFPTLSADLVVSHVGPGTTKLAFEGTYQPPLGPLGRVVDRVLLGRFADSTVKHWVDRLAQELSSESAFS